MKIAIKKYWKLILVLLVLVIAGLLWRSKTESTDSSTVINTEKVKRADFVKIVSSSGKTQAKNSVELKFQTSGKLRWVGVQEGDRVHAYQAIASMDSREVQKTLEKSLRDYSNERNDFEETWRVTYDGRRPVNALTDTVKRILEKNQWDLEKAVLDVELKSLAVEYSTLVTPIAGIVTHVDTPVAGINITPATSVFEIIDPSSILFEANIDEVDVGGLQVGQQAHVNLDAYPDRTLEGTVSAIAYSAKTSTGGATVFPVKVSLSVQDAIRVGLNGDVTIETQKSPQSLIVPFASVREDDKGKFVYKKTGSSFQKTRVTIGIGTDDEIVILNGLDENDDVATKGFSNIKPISP